MFVASYFLNVHAQIEPPEPRRGLYACYQQCVKKAQDERLPRSWYESCIRYCEKLYKD